MTRTALGAVPGDVPTTPVPMLHGPAPGRSCYQPHCALRAAGCLLSSLLSPPLSFPCSGPLTLTAISPLEDRDLVASFYCLFQPCSWSVLNMSVSRESISSKFCPKTVYSRRVRELFVILLRRNSGKTVLSKCRDLARVHGHSKMTTH